MLAAKSGDPITVSQAASYVVMQVTAMLPLRANSDRFGDLARELDGGVRARNVFAVESALRAALEKMRISAIVNTHVGAS